jgi:IS1 family transposase
MYPELIHQMVLERTARFQRDTDRQAREAHIRPPQPVRTAIERRLSACREELERLARRRGAVGRSTE